MAALSEMIICETCGDEKKLSDFHIRKDIKCGHLSSCKDCVNSIRRKKNDNPIAKERRKKQRARQWQENKDKIYARNRVWVESNRDWLKKYYKQYNETNKTKRRDQLLQKTYGISLIEYNEMFIIQNGRCAICGIHQTETKNALNVDHNHKTGEVRGLLCSRCNLTIGSLHEDITLLKKAILYLGE